LKWLSVDVTGTVDVSFTDTSYRTDSDYELTYVTGGGINSLPESTIVVTFASSSAGTWTALAEQQSVADGVLSSADEQPVGQPDLTINVDGEELTTEEQVGDLLLGVLPRSIVANALFTCDAPALAPELGEFISTGFWSLPLTLTPR